MLLGFETSACLTLIKSPYEDNSSLAAFNFDSSMSVKTTLAPSFASASPMA